MNHRMDDLVQWLRDRLDDDERIARGACWDDQSDEWSARPPQKSYERYCVVDYLDDGVVAVTPENADPDGVGQHVARHDPARVLREVESKRRVSARILNHAAVMGWDEVHGDVLRSLALPYADRPGYLEEWRP